MPLFWKPMVLASMSRLWLPQRRRVFSSPLSSKRWIMAQRDVLGFGVVVVLSSP